MKSPLKVLAASLAALLATGAVIAGSGEEAPRVLRSDTDGDGRVSRAEAEAASAKRTTEWFDKLDADKDGYVTQDEAKQARDKRRDARHERMDEHFKSADGNGDGQLSLEEVQSKLPRLAERFNDIDADKNGLLSKEELVRNRPKHRRPAS